MRIYFFGGIHGVGKSSLCRQLSNHLNIKHFSAGELINQGIQKNKEVERINVNQDVLIAELRSIQNEYDTIILDGHYTILSKGNIVYIPDEIYYEMNLIKMFLITCDVNHIKDRILARDNKQYDIDLLHKMQESEIKRYKELCKKMKFEEYIIDTTNQDNMYLAIIPNI